MNRHRTATNYDPEVQSYSYNDDEDDEFDDEFDENYEELPEEWEDEELILDRPGLNLPPAPRPPVGLSRPSDVCSRSASFHSASSSSSSNSHQTFAPPVAEYNDDDDFSESYHPQEIYQNHGVLRRSSDGTMQRNNQESRDRGSQEDRRSGYRRQHSTGGIIIEDGLNTVKIKSIRSGLRPTITKGLSVNNSNTSETETNNNSTGKFGSLQINRKKETLELRKGPEKININEHNVGNGQNSVKIKSLRDRLRVVENKPAHIVDAQPESTTIVQSEIRPTLVKKKVPPVVPASNNFRSNSEQQQQLKKGPLSFSSPPPPPPSSSSFQSRPSGSSNNATSHRPNNSAVRGDQMVSVKPSKGPERPSLEPVQVATTSKQSPSWQTAADGNARQGGRTPKKVVSPEPTDDRINIGVVILQDADDGLNSQNWYFDNIGRELCEEKLDRMLNETGSYMVRESQRGGSDNPYTLSVVFQRSVYHLNIRQRQDGKFSLGKPKADEKVFNSVVELITFHKNNPIELMGDSQKRIQPGKLTLKKCPPKR